MRPRIYALFALLFLAVVALAFAFSGNYGPWLIGPTRGYLEDENDVAEWRVAYAPGVNIHVQASPDTSFSPHIELWDGVGLIDSHVSAQGETKGTVTMEPGGTVTNVLFLYVSGSAGTFPASFKVWKQGI